MMSLLAVVAFTVIFIGFFVLFTVKRMLFVVPPNEALILSGSRRSVEGKQVGYRVVRGGRALRIPMLERVDTIDLRTIKIDVQIAGAFTKGGIPLNVQGVANVKLPGEEPLLTNAVERFLGRSHEEIMLIAKETLEGNLRGVLAQLTPEQVNEDKNRFAQILVEEAEHDMNRIGLELDLLKIQNVTDDVGYLKSIGRIRGADLRREATIAEVQAQADAAVQKAQNWSASEAARYDAELAIGRQDIAKRVADARTKREAMIAASQGQVRSQIAKVAAEIERQKARALQVARQLEADVVQPAEAQRMKSVEQARGQAAILVERGKAEAQSMQRLMESYRKGGAYSKEVLALQSLLPMVEAFSGANHPLRIAKVTVLPPGGETGPDSLARKVIGTGEQIKAATGLDLPGLASKFMGSSSPKPPPAPPASPKPPAPPAKPSSAPPSLPQR